MHTPRFGLSEQSPHHTFGSRMQCLRRQGFFIYFFAGGGVEGGGTALFTDVATVSRTRPETIGSDEHVLNE